MIKAYVTLIGGSLVGTAFFGLLCYLPYLDECRAAKTNSALLKKLSYTTIVQDTSCVAYTKSGWMGCKTVLMSIGS